MLIDTRAIGFRLTDSIVRHVEAKLETSLGAFARRVLKATVRLEDINSDRGGVDKRCSVVVALRRHGVVVAEGVASDLYAAIDEAARRIRRPVQRAAERHLTLVRRAAAPAQVTG